MAYHVTVSGVAMHCLPIPGLDASTHTLAAICMGFAPEHACLNALLLLMLLSGDLALHDELAYNSYGV